MSIFERVSIYDWTFPKVPGGGLYFDGSANTCKLLNAYFLWPMFFNVFSLRQPSLYKKTKQKEIHYPTIILQAFLKNHIPSHSVQR
jgi:hypothetical protein